MAQLQSAAERSEQFIARGAKYFEESNTQYVFRDSQPAHTNGTLVLGHMIPRGPHLYCSVHRHPASLTKLRDMRCAWTLACIGLLMEHRMVVMSEGRDTDNVFVNGQVG
ncbi:hypothetical protein EDB89DRAFT_1902124 [Lactarius sanguifluus]|nr:hypothetical protein EDB89DRAFT_1902124 [Lactarius sanguifluus]